LDKRINLINNFGEKFKREKKGNFFFSDVDGEIERWELRDKVHQNEISLPKNFPSLLREGNILITKRINIIPALRTDTPELMPVIYPIDSNHSSYFKMLAGENVNKLKLNYNSRGFIEVGNEILDLTISFYYSPIKGWYMFKGRDVHGEQVKLNQ
jgi:hypothetical protein